MPEYLYQHPKNGKVISVIQSIHDKHEYTDNTGIKWNRVFTAPELNTEGTLKADCTAQQFSEYTGKRKGNIGDLLDRSAELSEKRKKIMGKDSVKEKYFKDWSKKRKGKRHPLSGQD
jgi:hypothetical protein